MPRFFQGHKREPKPYATRDDVARKVLEAVKFYIAQPHINGAAFKDHMRQLIGETKPAASLPFDGETFDPVVDGERLFNQLDAVFQVMKDGSWRTLEDIRRCVTKNVKPSTASVSARLRDLRKQKFGGHTVNRRRIDGGLFEYQLQVRE